MSKSELKDSLIVQLRKLRKFKSDCNNLLKDFNLFNSMSDRSKEKFFNDVRKFLADNKELDDISFGLEANKIFYEEERQTIYTIWSYHKSGTQS